VKMDFVNLFFVEAKMFDLSMAEEAFFLRLEERRGMARVAFLGKLCTAWLKSTIRPWVCNPQKKDLFKSFSEGSNAFIVHRG
jgi:hypothetical protein